MHAHCVRLTKWIRQRCETVRCFLQTFRHADLLCVVVAAQHIHGRGQLRDVCALAAEMEAHLTSGEVEVFVVVPYPQKNN